METQISEAQLNANRENAQKSTGPVTAEGKLISSHNALKTGLTGRTVLLATDDVAQYQAHLARYEARYQPKTEEERELTETLADLAWRLQRIPSLETMYLAVGRKRCAHLHPDEPAGTRAAMIEVEAQLEFQKPLANLALQETRINRLQDRALAKLEALQTARREQEEKTLEEAAQFYLACEEEKDPFSFNDMTNNWLRIFRRPTTPPRRQHPGPARQGQVHHHPGPLHLPTPPQSRLTAQSYANQLSRRCCGPIRFSLISIDKR